MSPKIVIIGAGASGIGAAVQLFRNGLTNVTILESEDRIGGRIHTVQFGKNVVDFGAQWCHGEKDNIVYETVKHLMPFGSTSEKYRTFFCIRSNKEALSEEVCEKLTSLARETMGSIHKVQFNTGDSLERYIEEKYEELLRTPMYNDLDAKTAEQFLEFYKKFENSIEASSSLNEVSAEGYMHYWECEGDSLLNWKDQGYKFFLDTLMGKHKTAFNNAIRLGKRVEHIIWDQPDKMSVAIKCTDGDVIEADHVICTVSLGVLQEQHLKLFSPQLPLWKQRAIEGISIGTVDKIYLEFDKPFWPENWSGFNLLWEQDDLEEIRKGEKKWMEDIFGFYTVDYQPNILCGWIFGVNAKCMERQVEKTVRDVSVFLLRKFLNWEVPEPISVLRSSWYSNPNFRGSYSFRSTQTDILKTSASDLAKPLQRKRSDLPVVLFAGEATHDHYYSTVHGATESGFREAQRIIDLYTNEKPHEYDVIILGAGLAGLGAATTLKESNVKFCILEAQNYVGGRVKTTPMLPIAGEKPSLSDTIDAGAQWLHGEQNSLYAIAAKYNLLLHEVSEEGIGPYLREDGYTFDDFFQKKIDFCVGQILEECEKFCDSQDPPQSVEHFLKNKFQEYISKNLNTEEERKLAMQLLDWHIRFQIIDNSCNALEQVSAKSWGLYSLNGESCQAHINFKKGFGSLIDVIVSSLKEYIKTEKVVENVYWDITKNNKEHITINCTDGVQYVAKHVIVTFSIGVLKAQMTKLFKPMLPRRLEAAINCLGFGVINKIFIQFSHQWWSDMRAIQLVYSDTNYKNKNWTRYLSGFDVLAPGSPNTILGWIGGPGALEMEKLSDEEIIQDCLQILRDFTKLQIPNPVKYFCTRWGTNEFIRGGYSYISTKCDKQGFKNNIMIQPVTIEDLHNTCSDEISRNLEKLNINEDENLHKIINPPLMLFAGEACHDRYFSTAHGAFLSGIEQAQKLLKYM